MVTVTSDLLLQNVNHLMPLHAVFDPNICEVWNLWSFYSQVVAHFLALHIYIKL